jgi:predicted ATPase/DNA-binding CsgD family transcriptional regulator
MESKLLAPLTEREREIVHLIEHGLSNHEIADKLVLTYGTVKWYSRQIYSKLGVSTRAQAIKLIQNLHIAEASTPERHDHMGNRLRLPPHLTTFIGREQEIAEVRQLLRANRLLTLTGMGGTGKTRLALQVASQSARDFADGVYFVDLAPLSQHELVPKAIAAAVGVMENSNEPVIETLKRALVGQEILLLIDNFEHVLDGAAVVSGLLAAAPRLKVLVTSREALHLSGEQEYPVPPLSLPDANILSTQELTQSEAVSLFVQRAQLALPSFAIRADNALTIAQICARLDGLPLAIELAAGRCKLLSPQAMLERLNRRLTTLTGGSRDAPQRQKTLRDTIEWSYNLLTESERILFARLAVFQGGRSLEAIEAVCGEGLTITVFDDLASLVEKNLILQKETPMGEPRFVMLETLHEYAWEQLEKSGEAETMRRRHAEYFVELAERVEPELRLAQQSYWFQILEIERDNLHAVLEWSMGGGEVTFGVRLAGALCLFWFARGYHVEGRQWIQQLLGRLDNVPLVYHIKLLYGASHMTYPHELELATHLSARALRIARDLGDRIGAAWSLIFMSYNMMKEKAEALATAEEGLSLFRELNHKPGVAQALNIIGEIALFNGDDDRARRAYEECLTVSQETGETRRIRRMFSSLAFLAEHQGDYARAKVLAKQGLQLALEMNNHYDVAFSLAVLAGAIGVTGQPERAAHLLGAWEAVLEKLGAFLLSADKPEYDRNIAAVRAQLDEATFESAWAEGRQMTLEQAVAEALGETSGS